MVVAVGAADCSAAVGDDSATVAPDSSSPWSKGLQLASANESTRSPPRRMDSLPTSG